MYFTLNCQRGYKKMYKSYYNSNNILVTNQNKVKKISTTLLCKNLTYSLLKTNKNCINISIIRLKRLLIRLVYTYQIDLSLFQYKLIFFDSLFEESLV